MTMSSRLKLQNNAHYRRERKIEIELILEMLLEERTHSEILEKNHKHSKENQVENKKFCNLIDFIKDKENTAMPY